MSLSISTVPVYYKTQPIMNLPSSYVCFKHAVQLAVLGVTIYAFADDTHDGEYWMGSDSCVICDDTTNIKTEADRCLKSLEDSPFHTSLKRGKEMRGKQCP